MAKLLASTSGVLPQGALGTHTLAPKELQNSTHLTCHLCSHLLASSLFRTDIARVRATLAAKNIRATVDGNPTPRTELEAWLFRYTKGFSLCLGEAEGDDKDLVTEVSLFFTDCPDRTKDLPRSLNTNSDESWQRISQGVQHCSTCHLHCKPQIIQKDQWPTRLLNVGVAETPFIKLQETFELDILALKYITLSRCWGDNMPTRLLRSNYSAFKERIAFDDLPKTFRDAVEITRKLGLRFLWIDSLCIVQDSSSDWTKESGRMHLVYQNSYLTIAAGAAVNANGGIFRSRNPMTMRPCYIKCDEGSQSKYVMSKYRPEEEENQQTGSSVLFTRAWVFQERILSPRLLIFGMRENYWEYLELKASEVYPNGIPSYNLSPIEDMFGIFDLRKKWHQIDNSSLFSLWSRWNFLVCCYSSLELSHVSDKLVALAGLAANLHKQFEGLDYLAGIWSYRLRKGLLWESNPGSPWRKPSYTAPSWSWASVDGKISSTADTLYFDGLVEVLDAKVSLSSLQNPYGMVEGGYVRLKAPLIRSRLYKGRNGQQWYIKVFSRREVENNDVISDLEATEIFPLSKVEIDVFLDDRATSDSLQTFVAYLMPVETILTRREDGLCLGGLVVLPTHLKRGQFRRIGCIQITDYWDGLASTDNKVGLNRSHTRSPTAELDKSQCHLETQKNEEINTSWITELYVIEWLEKKGVKSLSPVDNEVSARFKAWVTEQEKDSARTHRKDYDPYCNGTVNRTLLRRYKDMGALFPNITSFLNYVALEMQKDLGEDHLVETLYEEVHSEYKVFHVI